MTLGINYSHLCLVKNNSPMNPQSVRVHVYHQLAISVTPKTANWNINNNNNNNNNNYPGAY